MLLPQGRLKSIENTASGYAFDRCDLSSVCLHRQHSATFHRQSVDEHSAGTAVSRIAAELCSGQTEPLSQEVYEQQVNGHRLPMFHPIYRE
jgi:hypothetical protein